MRRIALAGLLVASTAATAAVFDDYIRDAEEAHKRCVSAWFQSRRMAALDDLKDAASSAILQANIFDKLHTQKISRINGYLSGCAKLTYPQSKTLD